MEFLGRLETWVFWAYYAGGLAIMAFALIVHLRATPTPGAAPWLVVVAAFCGVIGAIIGGVQAGPHPPTPSTTGVELIRAFWVTGITLGVVASGLYLWGMRKKE